MMATSPIPKTLRALAKALESLDQHELDAIASGRGKLVFVSGEKRHDKPASSGADVEELIATLNGCETRESALKALQEVESKERLIAIAKALKVHVVKQDRREDIEGKIVSFAIGGRLRSEAIQSLNMNGSGNSSSVSE